MTDQKITQLNENTAIAETDLLVVVDDPGGSPETQKITRANLFTDIGLLNFRASTKLTISSGAVTITQTYHAIDTESDAASDDLDNIAGGSNGDLLIIRPYNLTRTVVAKDTTGNLHLAGDFSMDHIDDILVLLHNGSWWVELSRSNNS